MINSSTNGNSAIAQGETSSLNENVTTQKKQITKKNKKPKKKTHKLTTTTKQLEINCYKDLCSRKVVANDDLDRSMNAFITRTRIKDQVFEQERYRNSIFRVSLSKKCSINSEISPALEKNYGKLLQVFNNLEDLTYKKIDDFEEYKNIIEAIIIELISIKQEIVRIWNKENPKTPYRYGKILENGDIKLEDKMLDCVQVQLCICYSKMEDGKNEQIIIDQLIEQKSRVCFGVLNSMFIRNITNYKNLDKFKFKDMLIKYGELERFYSKKDALRRNKNDQMSIIATTMKLFLDKAHIDYLNLINDEKLSKGFLVCVSKFVCWYCGCSNYIKEMQNLSLGIDLYYKNIEDPLFKGIHSNLLTENGIFFMSQFSSLINKLEEAIINNKNIEKQASKDNSKNKLLEMYIQEIHDAEQQIEQFFINYNIPITGISSWYNTFMEAGFREIFSNVSVNCTIALAKWVDLSINSNGTEQANTEIRDNIKNWLDILENDYKRLSNDTRDWNNIPIIILYLFPERLMGHSIRFTFGTRELSKQKELAVFHAKAVQSFYPFLGTILLAIAHKDSYDDLLSDMDMLEFISKQTDKTKYVKSSKYLIAQIITYLLDKNADLDLEKKQFLVTKAEKLYLELADAGINQAYLLLAETVASLAKAKMYTEDFLEAAKLYDQASNYCEILSKVDNLEDDLQDRAIINMNCFSAEAEVLRKINEEQTTLLDYLEASTTPNKKKKKAHQKTVDIAKTSEQQELAEEITETELASWHQIYKTTASKPQGQKATRVKKTKKIESVAKLPTREEIDSKRNFWQTTKELQESATNLETSYTLLINLTQNNYFKMLESQFKNGIIEKDSWIILFVYQNMAYYNFLQLKNAKEIGNNNMKLFYTTSSKTKGATKAEKVTFEKLSAEAEQLIRQVIKLVCTEIADVETKDIRELILSLSPNDYSKLPQSHTKQLAASISTYGHLKSLEDISKRNKGDDRLAAKPYDKADEINPYRLIRKQQEKQAS